MATIRDTGVFGRRPVNEEFLQGLMLIDQRIYPLQGAVYPRQGLRDPRLKTIISNDPSLNVKDSDTVCFYEHIATIKHAPTKTYFVAFRETMDALLAQQSDPDLFPEWLMKHPAKKTELSVFIYRVKCHPTSIPNLKSHEDWLDYVSDPLIQDTLAFFLLNNEVINQEMYGALRE
jgi:hypothetical protein